MKHVRLIVVGLVVLTFLVGCASKPTKEIEDATAAVKAVIAEGLEKFAPEDAKKLNDAVAAMEAELKVQDGKTFKSYDKTKQMLADISKMAAEMKAALPAKKEAAKQAAVAAVEAAKAAAEEAKKLLAKAPKGKGTAADIEALKGDVKGIDDAFAEIQGLIDKEDFAAAVTKANAVKEKAAAVADQVTQAMEKAKKK